jgi:hypothetical protein
MVVLSTRRADGELNQLVDFNLPKAQRPLNSTTSLSGDANVPGKFLTALAEMVGRVGIEPTTN